MLIQKNNNKTRIVIIGGGFGGVEVARRFKDKDVSVLLIDRNNYHTFQPLMYQVATGTLSEDAISFPIRKMFKAQTNFSFRLAEVLHIDTNNKEVNTSVGNFEYDFLVIASGATSNFFGNQQLEQNTSPMKSIIEALDIRNDVLQSLEKAVLKTDPIDREPYLNFIVVGGGPTGVELSGAIAEIQLHMLKKDYPELSENDMQVYLIEGAPKLLGALSEKSSIDAERYLKEMGVKVITNTQVISYDGDVLYLNNGSCISSKTVIWGAGVKGQFPTGIPESYIERGNRIRINEQCEVEGLEGVYAIGDVSAMITEKTPNGLPGVAPVAQQQGRFITKHILNILSNKPNTKVFSYVNKGSMATIGRNRAVVDLSNNMHLNGFFAWLIWMFVHLVSIFGFRNKLVTFVNWTLKFLTKNSGIRLILKK